MSSLDASSQKSGADQLVNPGQKDPGKSSSANLPQIIEKMPLDGLEYGSRSQSCNGTCAE
jgi:hypothetical protein